MNRFSTLSSGDSSVTPLKRGVGPSLPTLALRAGNCAAALDISLSSFLALVDEGKMPKPIAVPGHKGLVLYDFETVRSAWLSLIEKGGASEGNPWDE